VDDDTIEISNLTREFLYNEDEIGEFTVVAAKMLVDTDFVILSADSPLKFMIVWIMQIMKKFAYSNAGYIGDLDKFSNNENEVNSNLNENYQAPSYGPLNTLVSSIQSNEVIRYFLGEDCRSKGTRLLIDSSNYSIVEEKF